MLYFLVLITFAFLVLNFYVTNGDYLHPSVLLCEFFLLYEFICVIGQSAYAITLQLETVLVLTCGFTVFTIVTMVNFGRWNVIAKRNKELYIIFIPKAYLYGLIFLQIVSSVCFIKYLQAIAAAWGSGDGSLAEMINLYDTMTKFWTSIFRNLNVSIPIVYRICNPIVGAGAYLVLYVTVNNFIVNRKINILHVIIIMLNGFLILLNGSRSPLLRLVTMVILLAYVFNFRKYGRRKGNIKFFLRLVLAVLIVAVFMIITLYIMGRAKKLGSILGYIFTYTGAPIVNLDTYISKGVKSLTGSSELFGAQTFKAGYAYIGKIFGIERFSYKGISSFSFSSNGIEIGNVYTTYYKFIYDFGYIGVAPLISIVAIYYICTYRKIFQHQSDRVIDFRLFIYAYLFNDLVMLTFSCRFYETVMDAPFLKFILLSWIFDRIIFENSFRLGKYKIRCNRMKDANS